MKNKIKLSLNKLTISKLQNSSLIQGGVGDAPIRGTRYNTNKSTRVCRPPVISTIACQPVDTRSPGDPIISIAAASPTGISLTRY